MCYVLLLKLIPIIEPTIPVSNCNRYDNINLNVNGFLVRRDTIIDKIMYINVNFNPSRYAFSLVFFPRIIDDIRIEIIGINNFITLVGNV